MGSALPVRVRLRVDALRPFGTWNLNVPFDPCGHGPCLISNASAEGMRQGFFISPIFYILTSDSKRFSPWSRLWAVELWSIDQPEYPCATVTGSVLPIHSQHEDTWCNVLRKTFFRRLIQLKEPRHYAPAKSGSQAGYSMGSEMDDTLYIVAALPCSVTVT